MDSYFSCVYSSSGIFPKLFFILSFNFISAFFCMIYAPANITAMTAATPIIYSIFLFLFISVILYSALSFSIYLSYTIYINKAQSDIIFYLIYRNKSKNILLKKCHSYAQRRILFIPYKDSPLRSE